MGGRAASRMSRDTLRETMRREKDKPDGTDVLRTIAEGIEDMLERKEPGARQKALDLVGEV